MAIFSSLNLNQKEAVSFLQVGTFLKYFDLMLFIHTSVLLNELFFPKTDPHTAALLTAFSFSSNYLLRPFGALIFGWIGDNFGRKPTVILTMIIMAGSCMVMANLPTYAQIGISAAWIVTLCRMLQGLCCMGEIMAAQIYLTETIKPPLQYPCVAFVTVSAAMGAMVALGVASLFTSFGFNWRAAFAFGGTVALIGSIARTRLRETPEFVAMDRVKKEKKQLADKAINRSKAYSSGLMFLLIECSWPICFYFTYIYCGQVMKSTFHYTASEIIHQNFIVTIAQCISIMLLSFMSYRIYPLKILKVKLVLFLMFVLICPFWLHHIQTPEELLILQSVGIMLAPDCAPAVPIFLKHFPILNRFTYSSFAHALSRTSMYVATSFGLIYATEFFGHWGVWMAFFPAIIGFAWGLRYFEKLEQRSKKPSEALKIPKLA